MKKLRLALILILAAAPCMAAAGGSPVRSGVAWPAPAALLAASEILPDPKSAQSMGWIILALGGLLFIYNEARKAITGGRPHKVEQPIQIQHVDRFVTTEHLNEKFRVISDNFSSVDKRFQTIETQLKQQVETTNTYVHEMRHENRNLINSLGLAQEERASRLTDKLDEHWKQLSHERSASTARLHDKVEASNAAVRTEIDQKISAVHGKIDAVPEKVITLLRQTGAIGRKTA